MLFHLLILLALMGCVRGSKIGCRFQKAEYPPRKIFERSCCAEHIFREIMAFESQNFAKYILKLLKVRNSDNLSISINLKSLCHHDLTEGINLTSFSYENGAHESHQASCFIGAQNASSMSVLCRVRLSRNFSLPFTFQIANPHFACQVSTNVKAGTQGSEIISEFSVLEVFSCSFDTELYCGPYRILSSFLPHRIIRWILTYTLNDAIRDKRWPYRAVIA